MAEAAYSEWLDAIPTAVFLADHGRILFANRSAAEWIGCPQSDLAGMPLEAALDDNHLKTRAGDMIPVAVTSAEVRYDGRSASLITAQKRDPSQSYRAAIEGSIEGFALLRAQRSAEQEIIDFIFVDVNQHALQQINKPRAEVVGCGICELMHIDRASAMFQACIRVVERQEKVYQEFHVSQRAIQDGWYQIQMIPIGDEIAIFNRDITQRKEAEEVVQKLALELEQQVRLLDEILATTPDVFILFDRAGHYLFTNRAGLENSGLTAEQVAGKTWRELGFPEEVGVLFEKRLEHVFTTGEPLTYEERFPTVRGLRDFVTTLTAIHDQTGQVIMMLNTVTDITERKQAEAEQSKLAAELEQQTRIFDEVLSTTPDTFLMFDRDKRFLYASPSALRSSELQLMQVIGKTWRELGFPADTGEQSDKLIEEVFATGATRMMEQSFPTVQGLRNFESIFSPLHDKDGSVTAVVVTNRDMTERKQAEEALHENQKLFTSIYETALAGIAVISAAGIYMQVNPTYCAIYGYTAAEMIGKHFRMIVPPETQEDAVNAHDRFIQGERHNLPSYWRVVRKDGQEIDTNVYSNLLIRENGDRFRVAVVIDVTAQKQAQRALEESEKRLTSILNSLQDVVWSVTIPANELLYVNPAIKALTGYSPEAFHADHDLLRQTIHLEDRAQFAAQLHEALDGIPIDTDYRITRSDGALRWVHNRFWLVRDADGNPLRIDGIMSDDTDRRQASEHAIQWTVERERVRILSDFVRDASHEFRTPLSVINTRLYLMEKVNDPDKQAEYIEGIKEQGERILKLVESLITMSRLDSAADTRFEHLEMNHLLTVMNMNTEAAAWRKGIQFNIELSPEALYLRGEMNDLMTAFNEIFDNALTYTLANGRVSVRTYRLNDNELAVEVRDTGVGIQAEELPHIFDRFYRADRARSMRGFGLGLTIARKIVERHEGRIEVESEPQQGSLFRLVFPLDPHTSTRHEA